MPSPQQNQAVVARWFAQLTSSDGGLLEHVHDLFAPDVIVHAQTGEVGGRELSEQHARAAQVAMPDMEVTVQNLIFHDDLVILQFEVDGTHTGPLGPIPPTGRRLRSTGAMIARFNDAGQVSEVWPYLAPGYPLTLGATG